LNKITIDQIELRRIFLPYVAPFETSGWREQGSHAIIVRIEAEGIVAWGEAPVGENPFYNEENQKTAWSIMQDYLAPMLLKTELASPWDVTPAFARVRGNRMAKAGLEFTVWDLFARLEGRSLASLLGGTRDRVGGRQRGHPEGHPHAAQGGGKLPLGRLHSASSSRSSRAGTWRRPAPCARRGRNCCCRWTPTASTAWRTARTWPNWTRSTCC
jgi:hypothetical protein